MKTLSIFSLFIFILSCAESPQRAGSRGVIIKSPVTSNEEFVPPDEKFKSWVEQVNLICGELNCELSTGALLIGSGSTKSQCTAFFINQSTVITNRHCLPPGLKKKQASCRSSVYLKTMNQLFECDRVLKISTLEDKRVRGRDLALLKMSSTSDQFINTEYIQVSESFVATRWKIEGDKRNLTTFHLKKDECEINPSGQEQFQTEGCITKKGNSGSPLISNSTGKAFGIIYSHLGNKDEDAGSKGHGTLFSLDFPILSE